MAENRGKQFENIVKECLQRVPGVSIDRVHDQMTGYLGSSANICDFIAYKKPLQVYIECKSVHGNTFTLSGITDKQWNGLLEKSKLDGVKAGVLIWFVEHDKTLFYPIKVLQAVKEAGLKSVRPDPFSFPPYKVIEIPGKKKRVFFDYDFINFFEEVANT